MGHRATTNAARDAAGAAQKDSMATRWRGGGVRDNRILHIARERASGGGVGERFGAATEPGGTPMPTRPPRQAIWAVGA